jgi:hypothetical protein
MKVFISWSGKRSKETADILCSWIRQVIQSAETWISSEIEKGTRWNEKVNKELEDTKVGIICLNRENLTSEWILFEAGALSKTSDAHVCTFLLDINPTDIKPPLGQFQHTLFSKEDIKKLMHTINNKIIAQKEKTLSEKDLDEIFEERWYKLEEKLNEIKNQNIKTLEPARTDRELLEEILQTVRSQYNAISDVLKFNSYDKPLRILDAEGQAEAILKIQKATAEGIKKINASAPSAQALALESIKTFAKMGDGKGTKIIIPTNLQDMAGLTDAFKEFMDEPEHEKKKKVTTHVPHLKKRCLEC